MWAGKGKSDKNNTFFDKTRPDDKSNLILFFILLQTSCSSFLHWHLFQFSSLVFFITNSKAKNKHLVYDFFTILHLQRTQEITPSQFTPHINFYNLINVPIQCWNYSFFENWIIKIDWVWTQNLKQSYMWVHITSEITSLSSEAVHWINMNSKLYIFLSCPDFSLSLEYDEWIFHMIAFADCSLMNLTSDEMSKKRWIFIQRICNVSRMNNELFSKFPEIFYITFPHET